MLLHHIFLIIYHFSFLILHKNLLLRLYKYVLKDEVRVRGPWWTLLVKIAGRGLVTPTTLPTELLFPLPALPPDIPPKSIPLTVVLVVVDLFSGLEPEATSGNAKFASSDSNLMSIFLLFESSSPAPFQSWNNNQNN